MLLLLVPLLNQDSNSDERANYDALQLEVYQ